MTDEWLTEAQAIGRDEDGKLIPTTTSVEFMEGTPKIQYAPVPKGKLKQLELTEGTDEEDTMVRIIKKHLLKPDPVEWKFEEMPQSHQNAIVWAILAGSTGLPQEYFKDNTLKQIMSLHEEYLKGEIQKKA